MPLNAPKDPFSVQLIMQYFQCGREDRQRELHACLQKNLDNPRIAKVHLLTEEPVDLSHLRRADKIAQTVIGERLTYERAFHYANAHAGGDEAWILANADIYFDESLRYLAEVNMTGKMFALTRHDMQKDGSMKPIPAVFGQGTQDAWIFKPPVIMENMFADFYLGVPGCDSRIAYEFVKAGYRVVNPSKKIIARHLDLTRETDPLVRAREYRKMITEENVRAGKVVLPPHYYIFPTDALDGLPLWEYMKKYREVGIALLKRTASVATRTTAPAGRMQENMYSSGTYIRNNPTLDAEDMPWKISKILPIVDIFLRQTSATKVKILDVGGGAGLYLKEISDHLRAKKIAADKYALDLSGEMLRIQRENNPDMKGIVECSIEQTPFKDKEFDLVLVIDVLEHIPNVAAALKEIRRISGHVIYKVPLENNLYYNILNIMKRGGLRRDIFQKVGHVHFFSPGKLKKQLSCTGEMVCCNYTNVFEWCLSEDYHRGTNWKEKMVFTLANYVFKISPGLCSRLFPDSIACLVQCR